MRINPSFAAIVLAFGAALPLGAQGTYNQTVPLDPANLDRSANACTDFYQFANGGWLKSNPLPAAYSRWEFRGAGRKEPGDSDQDPSDGFRKHGHAVEEHADAGYLLRQLHGLSGG